MAKHLAIFTKDLLEDIFEGKKKIDGRFSKIKIPPFGKVSAGDVVLMKLSGEGIKGQFVVDRVFYFDHPNKDEIDDLKKKYSKEMNLISTSSFWYAHENINYITLIFIKSVNKFLVPPEVKKKDLRSWVVLE